MLHVENGHEEVTSLKRIFDKFSAFGNWSQFSTNALY